MTTNSSTSGATSFFARRGFAGDTGTSSDSFGSRTGSVAGGQVEHDLISFLATAQVNEVDILPATWQPELDRVGAGGTSNIQQSFVDKKLSYVFKRIYRGIDEPHAYKTLVSEISILGHQSIRGHPNIVKLTGVSWDVISSSEPIWPALIFQKSEHGDLKHFMKSGAGASLDFEARIKLCNDIAVGITALHEIDIVHGDIKPMNILIFEEKQGDGDAASPGEVKYVAKIGDFGYSSLREQQVRGGEGDDEEGDDVRIPISRPWNAPEVTNWSSTFPLREAKLTDAFSFGLVALWLLFNNRLLELGVDVEKPVADPEWKHEERLKEIISVLVEKQDGLQEAQRDGIKQFFLSTLTENPAARSLDMEGLMGKFTTIVPAELENQGMSDYDRSIYYQKYAYHNKHKDFDPTPLQEAYLSHHSQYQNPYSYYNPYNPVNIYTSATSRGYYMNQELYPKITQVTGNNFLIYRGLRQLAQGDYRVWKNIFDALKKRTTDPRLQQADRGKAAYQLAFCYEMGFGVAPDAEQVTYYLTMSGASRATMNHEIQIIREDKQTDMFMFKKLDGKIDSIRHIEHYLTTEKLEDVQAAYTAIAQAANEHLKEDHPISINLNKILASTFSAAGDIEKAEALYTHLVSVCDEFYGESSQYGLGIMECLAECSRKRGDLAKAEKITEQIFVAHLKPRLDSEPKLQAMEKLAISKMEVSNWADAAELQLDVVKLKEEKFGKSHKLTFASIMTLMYCLEKQRLLRPPEKAAVDTLKKAEGGDGEQDKSILEAQDCLFSLYEKLKSRERLFRPFKPSYFQGYYWDLALRGYT
ncbi:hypothetical protein TWF718_001116 [Orbilia javanica]|uniref:Protein kinase domain-containing protein n=1 Tax=Orbilia javanica TaxID=47235 RepID=A0AAN8RGM6_9PEZI